MDLNLMILYFIKGRENGKGTEKGKLKNCPRLWQMEYQYTFILYICIRSCMKQANDLKTGSPSFCIIILNICSYCWIHLSTEYTILFVVVQFVVCRMTMWGKSNFQKWMEKNIKKGTVNSHVSSIHLFWFDYSFTWSALLICVFFFEWISRLLPRLVFVSSFSFIHPFILIILSIRSNNKDKHPAIRLSIHASKIHRHIDFLHRIYDGKMLLGEINGVPFFFFLQNACICVFVPVFQFISSYLLVHCSAIYVCRFDAIGAIYVANNNENRTAENKIKQSFSFS